MRVTVILGGNQGKIGIEKLLTLVWQGIAMMRTPFENENNFYAILNSQRVYDDIDKTMIWKADSDTLFLNNPLFLQ